MITISRKYILKSKRIGFSTWEFSDIDLANSLWSDEKVTSLIGGPFSNTLILQRLKNEVTNYDKYKVQYFTIFDLVDETFIGCAGLRPIIEQGITIYECGVHLLTHAQGKGFGSEALTKAIAYGYNLGISEIYAGHNPKNTASKKMLLKIGFKYLKDNYYKPTGLMHPWYVISKK